MAIRATKHRILDAVIAQRSMTHGELAERVGVCQSYISMIAAAQRMPSRAVDERIRETLDYWESDLYDIDAGWVRNRKAAIMSQIKRLQAELKRLNDDERGAA